MNDDDSQYEASKFLRKKDDDDSQYLASNFVKKSKKENPGLLERAANDVRTHINEPIERLGRSARNMAGGFAQGLANIVPGLYNLGASGVNALGANVPKSPMIDIVSHGPSATAGEVASFFSPGGAAKSLGRIPEISQFANHVAKIPLIAHAIKEASSILSKAPTTSKVAGNAILGGAYAPDNQLTGMALGGAAPLIGKGIEKTYNALKPSKLFRGNLSPQELQNNLRITKDTETGLGDVIGSPWLKRMNENVLTKIPFSGVTESMQRNAGNVINKGHELLEKLSGDGNIENLDQFLNDALKDSYKSHNLEKNAHYNDVNKLADEEKLTLDLPGFAKKARDHKNAIQETNIIKHDPEMQSLLKKLGLYENPLKTETTIGKIVDKHGNPLSNETKTIAPSLKEANLLKSKLYGLSKSHGSSPDPFDRHLAGVFGDLHGALRKDIRDSIEKSGHEGLAKQYNIAEENYAKNYSPFLDKQIHKFINGNADPETLVSSFVKTGKSTDRANLINKLNQKLPEKDRNLLGYTYLQRAMDENNVLNPMKLKTLLSKNALGNRQFEALFPDPVLRNELRDYVKLVDMNQKGLKVMWNPETGQMNMDVLPLLSKSPTNFLAKIIGAPYLGKKLRSEKTRTKLVTKMIGKSK